MDKVKVLFLCTANSARSQMAEAFLRRLGGQAYDAYSAGLEPGGINPYTRQVMQEVGLDLAGHTSKGVEVYLGKQHFGYLITVCANAEARCPTTFPGVGQRLHWSFDDPAATTGSEADKLAKFRAVRDQIAERVRLWLIEQGTPSP